MRTNKKPVDIPQWLASMEGVPGCWLWPGTINSSGYGKVYRDGKRHNASRVTWEEVNGPWPEGHEPDHVCHTRDLTCRGGSSCPHRSCARPDHIEPVTRVENAHRRTGHKDDRCPKGHIYGENGLYIKPNGQRVCRECRRIWKRTAHIRKKETQGMK